MPHDFADLIKDLDAATSDLARTVKRCRASVEGRTKPAADDEKSAFNWKDRQDR